MGCGPPKIMAAWYVAAGFATRGRLVRFFAVAEFSTLAKTGLLGANEVEATRRVGNEDRAKASAAGVGRVTAVRHQYAEAIGVAIGPIVPPRAVECPVGLRDGAGLSRRLEDAL